jgi:hypothetical protein
MSSPIVRVPVFHVEMDTLMTESVVVAEVIRHPKEVELKRIVLMNRPRGGQDLYPMEKNLKELIGVPVVTPVQSKGKKAICNIRLGFIPWMTIRITIGQKAAKALIQYENQPCWLTHFTLHSTNAQLNRLDQHLVMKDKSRKVVPLTDRFSEVQESFNQKCVAYLSGSLL